MDLHETKFAKSGREIIHIQVGKAGNAIGNQFWKLMCEEHGVNTDSKDENMKGCLVDDGDSEGPRGYIDVFFNEGKSTDKKVRYVPRAILLDTNMGDLASIAEDVQVGDLYRPEDIIGNDESSGNCYAKAFHTEGPDLADRCLEMVRKEVEKCNCLQGVQFCHSASGGTGTGLTGLLLKTLRDYLDKQSRAVMQSFVLAPAPAISDVVLEPYNACLCFQDLLEYTDQVFLFDNKALGEICQRALEKDMPKMVDLNSIIALCMSGITSCLRYTGPLNADLRKLQTNLVPFKNAHFLINGLAPLNSLASGKYRRATVLDLSQQMLSKDNVTVKCDPLNPGDEFHGMQKARFLASWTSWKGKFQTKEVDKAMHEIQKDGSRYDKFFPDWIPNCIERLRAFQERSRNRTFREVWSLRQTTLPCTRFSTGPSNPGIACTSPKPTCTSLSRTASPSRTSWRAAISCSTSPMRTPSLHVGKTSSSRKCRVDQSQSSASARLTTMSSATSLKN